MDLKPKRARLICLELYSFKRPWYAYMLFLSSCTLSIVLLLGFALIDSKIDASNDNTPCARASSLTTVFPVVEGQPCAVISIFTLNEATRKINRAFKGE